MARERRRGWTGLIIGLVILLAVLWVGYWFAAHTAAESAIARLAASGRVICSEAALSGFPTTLDIRCARVTYGAEGGPMTAALGGVAATAPLVSPWTVGATLDAPAVVNAPGLGLALTATWSLANANASVWLSGLTGAEAHFVSLKVENNDSLPGLPLASLAASEAGGGITPAGGGSYTVHADATDLAITRLDGRTYPPVTGEARMTLVDVGDGLGSDPAETILTWARNGGTARIDRLKMVAEGATVTADGSLRLSQEGRLNGSVLLRWNDIARLADLIEAILPGTRERFETPLQGLNAVSVAVETEDGPLRQTALTFTEGVIWLGIFPLPIDPIPPIRF